jgi:hypothetical protein
MVDMTGDAPQPGETPRDEGSPWSFADPASPWWRPDEQDPPADRPRNPRRRGTPAAAAPSATPTLDPPQPAQHTGAAAAAHEAGAQDVLAALTGEPPQGGTGTFTVPDHPPTEPKSTVRRPAAPRHAQPPPTRPTEPQAAPPQTDTPQSDTPQTDTPVVAAVQTEALQVDAPQADAPQTDAPQAVATRATPPRAAKSQAAEPQADKAGPQQEAKAVEHDHDVVDAERFNAEGDGTVYAARNRVRPTAVPERETTIIDLLNTIPVEPGPEVMVLPEPERNRPTVALERGPVPGQPPTGLSRLGRARADRARADRALQDRVRHERTAALLETSPFWKAEEERRAQAWPPPETREKVANAGQPPRRRAREPRRPVTGLFGLLALGLIAAFFAWVSAEPFWLAVGHGTPGTATVERCTGSGVTQRCAGTFIAGDATYRVDGLALFGVDPGQRIAGATTPARMVSSDSRQAYVGSAGVLVHLRWALSFALVLLCGLGIAGLTGARRLDTARARRGALLISLAGPLALLGGFLYITY